MRPIFKTLSLLLAFTVLPACAANTLESARVSGTVKLGQHHDLHHGAPIRVAFRAGENADWDAVESCSVKERIKDMRITLGAYAFPFEACTGILDTESDVELLAYIDLDEDGALSPGEPYGISSATKAKRELAPLTLRIDRQR